MALTAQAQGPSEAFLNQYSGHILRNEAVAFIIICTTAVALRFYARYLTMQRFLIDDYLLFAGYLAELGLCLVSILIVERGGVGWHVQRVKATNPELMVGWAKGIYAIEIIYLTAVALPKLSALAFYIRIFISDARYTLLRPLAYGTIALIIANWIAFVFAAIFQCHPIAFWWDKKIVGGTCFDVQDFYRAMCVPNLFTDIAVLALPIGSIYKLQMRLVKKLTLTAIFMTACVGIVASILRFKTFFDTEAFTDPTWASVQLVGWSVIEAGCYLLAACLPHLRPLALKVFGDTLFSSGQAKSHGDSAFERRRSRGGDVESRARSFSRMAEPERDADWEAGGTKCANLGFDGTVVSSAGGLGKSLPLGRIEVGREVRVTMDRDLTRLY